MTFDIRVHVDKLTPNPKEKNKYICPVCGGKNLSISSKGEPPPYSCFSSGCAPAEIKQAIAPLSSSQRSSLGKRKPETQRQSAKERERTVQINSARVESKVEELLLQGVAAGIHTLEQARITLEQWCKAEGFNLWSALKLFEAQAKELGFDAKGLTLDQAQQFLKQAILEGLKGSDVEALIADLSRQTGHPPQILQRIYGELEREADLETATEGATADLEQLRAIQGQQLPIKEALYGDGGVLARKIAQVADAMPTAPEFLVTTLIPVLATAMGTAHTLVIHATAGYTARAIFRSVIVASTGRKKTPAQAVILVALTKLEESAALDYQYELTIYEQDYKAWTKASKSEENAGPEPTKPTRRRYMSQDNTLAARVQIHAENPRGLLLHKDEASAFITERGRFTSGKGNGGELEADLSEFNGGAIMSDRKGSGSTFLPKTAINRVGAIQFSALQRLMGAHEDDCGEFARYLFCAADALPSKIDLDKDVGDIGLTSAVMQLFNDLLQLPESNYLLSRDAKEAFQAYQHELTDRQIAADHPSLQAAYPKFETYFGRFILWLHLVNAVLAGRAPEPTVDGYTVELARQWTEYYIGQLKLVLAVNSPQQELTGDLFRVYNYLKRKSQPLNVRAIVQGKLFDCDTDKAKRRSPYLRKLLSTLVEQGWIGQQNDFYSLTIPEQNPDVERLTQQDPDVEEMLSNSNISQKPTKQGFPGFLEPDVELLSKLSSENFPTRQNGNNTVSHGYPRPPSPTSGNGRDHLDYEPLTDQENTQLSGGGDRVNG